MKPSTQTIWNAVLTALGVAVLGTIGYLYQEIATLKEKVAEDRAVKFTEQQANTLRIELTDVMTDIDKRIALIENNQDWMKRLCKPDDLLPLPAPPMSPPPDPSMGSVPELEFLEPEGKLRKYDLRQQAPEN